MRLATVLAALLAAALRAAAQTNEVAPSAATNAAPVIEIEADRLEWEYGIGLCRASGNAVVKRGEDELRADSIAVQADTGDAWATGNVRLKTAQGQWQGENLYCNLRSGFTVTDGRSQCSAPPFSIWADSLRGDKKTVVGKDAVATTCILDYDHQHYQVHARRISIAPGDAITASHVVFYLGGVPVFYMPRWKETRDGYGFGFTPGYSSRMGAFLLTSYGYDLPGALDGRTHVDFRTERGVALGQDFRWRDTNSVYAGDVSLYYAYDVGTDEEENIDPNRYRIRLSHRQTLSDDAYVLARVHYLSDPFILDDFFRPEYRQEPTPVNYVSARLRRDDYTAGITTRFRLNDFHEAVERLPEATFEVSPTQVGESPFYYEEHSSLAFLRNLRAEGDERDDYSLVRVDSSHEISLSRKVAFVNIVPRAGYRATWYSETLAEAGEDADSVATNAPGDLRSVFEVGARASVKAFKVWREPDGRAGGLRHVVEPYVEYKLVPEPNLLPARLYQFDAVDTVAEENTVRLGVRNKLQTRTNGRPFDVLDVDLWSDGRLNAAEDERTFDAVHVDSELRTDLNLSLDVDAEIGFEGDALRQINAHLLVGPPDKYHADIEYRYQQDKGTLLLGGLTYSPNDRWSYFYSARFNFDAQQLEEQTFWVRRGYDCLYAAVGLNHVPGYTTASGEEESDEYQVLFRIWLRAFPDTGIGLE